MKPKVYHQANFRFMKLIIISMLLLLTACDFHFTENNLYGSYIPINYKNTYDTICIKPQKLYNRKVYDKNNNLVLNMQGRWELGENGTIRFHSFFLNLDRDVSKYPELLKDTLSDGGGWISKKDGIIQFCVGYNTGENCYKKVK